MADIAFAVGRETDFQDFSGRIVLTRYPKMKVHLPSDHPLCKRSSLRFQDLQNETFILYPSMKETFTRELQLSMLKQSGISFRIYEESCSPFFFDLLVPIGKGIRLWNWTDRTAPNSVLMTLEDDGYETFLYMLYDEKTENPTTLSFIEGFLRFRKERR